MMNERYPSHETPALPRVNADQAGALEAEVLALLQACRQAQTPGEVLQRLGTMSYSTVVTVLSRLFDKGLLARSKQGRAYAYGAGRRRPWTDRTTHAPGTGVRPGPRSGPLPVRGGPACPG